MKFAFVTPRYGADIATGPEHACRLLAQHISERHDVDVLTTCASDASTWKNDLSESADRVRGVIVRRFAVAQPHDRKAFQGLTARLLSAPHTREEERDWVMRLGPWSPGLLDYLTRHQRSYDAVIFFSLWHATTVFGLEAAHERSVLFPYLQARPALRFGLWRDVISSARAVGYVSATERALVHDYLRLTPSAEELVGIGIDPTPQESYPRHQQDPNDTFVADDEPVPEAPVDEDPSYLEGRGVPFRRRNRLYEGFTLYAGRVAPDNGSEEMLEYFDEYAGSGPDTALVLTGAKMMKVPEPPYLRMPGTLPDRDRMTACESADVTIVPDAGDLLAQHLLESLAVGTPVLASARNEAAVEHCRRANAGLYYANGEEFREALLLLTSNAALRESLGQNGRRYVQQHYRWDNVLGRFDRLVGRVRTR